MIYDTNRYELVMEYLRSLSNDEFIELIYNLDRCVYCGAVKNGTWCHCTNDE